MRRSTSWLVAVCMAALMVTASAIPAASPPEQDAGDGFAFDVEDPPEDALRVQAFALPGQAVVLDVDVERMTMQAHAVGLDEALDRPLPAAGDVACTNLLGGVLGVFMGPSVGGLAAPPGAAASVGGDGCTFAPVPIQQDMQHVRLVSAGSYHAGIQAYHHDEYGLFTVWCGGTFGFADRTPDDGDWFWEGPGDVAEDPDPTLVNCYAITRGDVHPSQWGTWSVMSINWHEDAGILDSRISVQ